MDIQTGTKYSERLWNLKNTFFLIQTIKLWSRSTFGIITRHIKGISQHAYNMWSARSFTTYDQLFPLT